MVIDERILQDQEREVGLDQDHTLEGIAVEAAAGTIVLHADQVDIGRKPVAVKLPVKTQVRLGVWAFLACR